MKYENNIILHEYIPWSSIYHKHQAKVYSNEHKKRNLIIQNELSWRYKHFRLFIHNRCLSYFSFFVITKVQLRTLSSLDKYCLSKNPFGEILLLVWFNMTKLHYFGCHDLFLNLRPCKIFLYSFLTNILMHLLFT